LRLRLQLCQRALRVRLEWRLRILPNQEVQRLDRRRNLIYVLVQARNRDKRVIGVRRFRRDEINAFVRMDNLQRFRAVALFRRFRIEIPIQRLSREVSGARLLKGSSRSRLCERMDTEQKRNGQNPGGSHGVQFRGPMFEK
jgi:hypothetical protein